MIAKSLLKPYARSAMLLWKRYSARLLADSSYLTSTLYPRPLLFLVGCGRSGTTILGDMFSLHKDVTYYYEPYHLWAAVDRSTDVTNLNCDVNGRFLMAKSHASKEVRQRFQRLFQSASCPDDHRIAVEKTPHNAVRIGYIEALANDAHYIHIVRDGVQVARSIAAVTTINSYKMPHRTHYNQWWGNYMKKWSALARDGALAGYFPDEVGLLSEPIQWAAYEWLVTVLEIDKARRNLGDRLLEIRYSDLTEHPAEVLRVAAHFAGLVPHTSWIRRTSRLVHPERIGEPVDLRLPSAMCKAFNELEERFGFKGRSVSENVEKRNTLSSKPLERIPMAIVCSSLTPYRLHMHRRFVREIPEVELLSVFAHERDIGGWRYESHPELGTVCFGMGENGSTRLHPRFFLREWLKAGQMIRWMEERNVRVVMIIGYDVANVRILRWCRLKQLPCFLWGDNNVRLDQKLAVRRLIKRPMLSLIISQCTAILVCGNLGKELYLKYGADPERIFFSPYEPDYSLIENPDEDAVALTRVQYGLHPNRRRIVFSGRLATVKRVDLLIEAFLTIADKRPDWDLVIIGDGPLRKELIRMIPEELNSRITWTGFIGRQEIVSALYRLCDVLVLPSDFEPWALVINEAAAAGLALVASDVVGAAFELVKEGRNGFTFASGSLTDLTEKLLMVTDGDRIDDFRNASKEVLNDWRNQADPVQGLRQALRYAKLLFEEETP
jgi:glycosyltransferase involved in cell wall biosynthesis